MLAAIVAHRMAFIWRHLIAPRQTGARDFRYISEPEPLELEMNKWFVVAFVAICGCLLLLALQMLDCSHASSCTTAEIWLNELILKLFGH